MAPPPAFPGWGPGGGGYQQPSSPALGYQQPAPPKGVPPIYGELGLGRYGIAPSMPGGWQERQGRQQGYQGRDTSRGRGRPERVIPRCDADFPIPPPSADVDELIENCKVLSLQSNPDAIYYLNENQLKKQDDDRLPRTEGALNMLPLMQIKLRLLGRCAQCLRYRQECEHLDLTCASRVSQCNQMVPLTREEWRARILTVRYPKLHDSVAVISGKVVIAPWLRVHLPQQQ